MSFLEATDATAHDITAPDATAAPAPVPVVEAAEDSDIITGPNTRVRAGNAMQRARAGAVRGAIETLARRGLRRLTMAETADRGGLARATLYNHVRDKEQLLALLLDHESQNIAQAFTGGATLEEGLCAAATLIAEHRALTGLREHDPAALLRLSVPEGGPIRELAAQSLSARGLVADVARVDLLLRWLVSFAASPSDAEGRMAQAKTLARTLA